MDCLPLAAILSSNKVHVEARSDFIFKHVQEVEGINFPPCYSRYSQVTYNRFLGIIRLGCFEFWYRSHILLSLNEFMLIKSSRIMGLFEPCKTCKLFRRCNKPQNFLDPTLTPKIAQESSNDPLKAKIIKNLKKKTLVPLGLRLRVVNITFNLAIFRTFSALFGPLGATFGVVQKLGTYLHRRTTFILEV